MDNLRVETGIKRMTINDDPNNVIEFNPMDTVFVERYYILAKEIKRTFEEGQKRELEIAGNKELDVDGFPVNIPESIAFTRELCEEMRMKVDDLFGNGTMKKIFGDYLFPEMFLNFLDAISPYLQSARAEKVAKYVSPPVKRNKHSAMK